MVRRFSEHHIPGRLGSQKQRRRLRRERVWMMKSSRLDLEKIEVQA